MLRNSLIILLLVVVSPVVKAQDIPHITQLLYTQERNRLANAETLRTYYINVSADSLYPVASFLINEGIRKRNKAWLYFGKYLISYYYNSKNRLRFSFENLLACREYYERIGDRETHAKVLDMLGQSCFLDHRKSEAIEYFVESMREHRNSHSDYALSNAQLNLAETFYAMQRYESAEKEIESFIRQAKKEQLNDACRKGYNLLGKIYLATERKAQAFAIWEEAMKLARKFKNPRILASNYNLMAIAFAERGDFSEARANFTKALELRKRVNDPVQICESAYNLGELAFLEGDFEASIACYQQALDAANRYGLLAEKADALEAIAYAYAELKQFDKAFEFQTLHAEKKDSLLTKISLQDLKLDEGYQQQYDMAQEFVQRDKERILESRIKDEQQMKYVLFGFALLLLGVMVLLLWRRSV